jgi:alpha-tubulin suppressor-like RCC1 family protein
VKSISTERCLSIVLKNDGTVVTLCSDYYDISEYAKQLKQITYVAAGLYVAAAINENGDLIIWGDNVERFYNKDLDNLILYEAKGRNEK